MYGLAMSAGTIAGWELGKWALRGIGSALEVVRGSRTERMTYCTRCGDFNPTTDHRCDPQKQARWAEFATSSTGAAGAVFHAHDPAAKQ